MEAIDLLVDFFSGLDRQGPGSSADTERAFAATGFSTSDRIKAADIGCGTGGQTLVLSNLIEGEITAVDLFPEFLEKLSRRTAGCKAEVRTLEGSMDSLPFKEETFDLIWSEGAVYNMGFRKGLEYWRRFLKPGASLAVSEITWTTETRPDEIEQFWSKEYPEISTADEKIRIIRESGYSPVDHFILPQSSWIDNYYSPMEKSFDGFLNRHSRSAEAANLIDDLKKEIEQYDKYKKYYSYGFYIAKRNL